MRDGIVGLMPTTTVTAAELEARLTPVEASVHAVATRDADGIHVKATFTSPVPTDRGGSYGWGLRPTHARLAQRLVAAINDGVIFTNFRMGTDVNGKTYLSATSNILGRTLNADLTRLGY